MLEVQEQKEKVLKGKLLADLIAFVEEGPLWDGDVPSKSGRDKLIDLGLLIRVVVKGEDGYTAANYHGAEVYRQVFGNSGTLSEAKEYRKKYGYCDFEPKEDNLKVNGQKFAEDL